MPKHPVDIMYIQRKFPGIKCVAVLACNLLLVNGPAWASPSPAIAEKGWLSEGRPMPDSENIKSKAGFGAQLWIVEESFFEEWNQPTPPRISVLDTAKKNETLHVIMLLINPGKTTDATTDVTADLKVTAPDGSVYGEFKDVPVLQGPNDSPLNSIQLSENNMAFMIEDSDLLGLYTVEAVVKDRIKGVHLPLKIEFTAED